MTPPAAPVRHAAPSGTVSTTSAERFAARVRARRRRRRGLIALGVVVAGGLGWLVTFSSWATVGRVEVTGTGRVDAAAVRAAAGTELGRPLLLARPDDVADRLHREQALIKSVTVTRQWPGAMRITVVERQPVLVVRSGSQFRSVDLDGVTIERSATLPRGLPLVEVDLGARDADAALRACFEVVRAMPAGLKSQVRRIGAGSADQVWLRLADGARVEWGDSTETPRKAQVLLALLAQRADVYDVRSPGTPAVRR